MKGVQCYELFGGIALKNHAFFSNLYNNPYNTSIHSTIYFNEVLMMFSALFYVAF